MTRYAQNRFGLAAALAVVAAVASLVYTQPQAGAIIESVNVETITKEEVLAEACTADQSIVIDHCGGTVRVYRHSDLLARVAVSRWFTPSATTGLDAPTSILDKAIVAIEEHGGAVHVKTKLNQCSFGHRMGIDLEIHVPENADVRVRNHRGDIVIDGGAGAIDAEAIEGDVEVLTVNSEVRARTSSGNIRLCFDGEAPQSPVSCKTLDGRINIELPQAHAFDLAVNALNSYFTSDFPITVNGLIAMPQFTAQVHGGGAPINIDTLAGDIAITRL